MSYPDRISHGSLSPQLRPRRVLVTGGGSGIGLAISELFARRGDDVMVHYASHAEGARNVMAMVHERGGKAGSIGGDFGDPMAAVRVVEETLTLLGGLDVLVNNAAWDPGGRLLEECDASFVQSMFMVNTTSPLQCIRAAADALSASVSGGSVINIGSVQSEYSLPGHVAYAACKGALDSLTRQLSVELGPRGVRVNSVNPGFIEVARTTTGKSSKELAARARRVPLRRLGAPDEIASIVYSMSTDAFRYMTGQVLTVDGGSVRVLPTSII